MTRHRTSTKVSAGQIERVAALLTIGPVVALERGKVTTDEANQILFSPHAMALLRAAGVRESVVGLVHAGMEIEDLESLLPDQMNRSLHGLVEDALACLASCEPYDFNAPKWIAQLLEAPKART